MAASKEIVLYPDPLLRMTSEPAAFDDPATRQVIEELEATLDNHLGVGISAPQIGHLRQVIVVDATRAKRPVTNHGRLVLLNPKIVLSEGKASFREGCMSIPDLVAYVPRADQITVTAENANGEPVVLTADGFESVILQHEIDHLNGVLFIDRVRRARDIKPRQ